MSETHCLKRVAGAADAVGASRARRRCEWRTARSGHFAMVARSFLGIHPLHHSKLWYFLSFGAFACLSPFLPLFYRAWGIDERQILSLIHI